MDDSEKSIDLEFITTKEELEHIEVQYRTDADFKKRLDQSIELLLPLIHEKAELIAYQLSAVGFCSFFVDPELSVKPFDLTKLAIVHEEGAVEPDTGTTAILH